MQRAKTNQCNLEEQKAGGLTLPDTEHTELQWHRDKQTNETICGAGSFEYPYRKVLFLTSPYYHIQNKF